MTVFSHVSSVLKKIFGSRYRKEAFKYWVLYSNKWFTNGFYYFLTIFMEKRIKTKVIELCHNTACMLKWFYFTRIYVKFWIFFVKLLSVPDHLRICMLWDDEIYNHHLPRSISLEWYSFNITILCITYAFGKPAKVNIKMGNALQSKSI